MNEFAKNSDFGVSPEEEQFIKAQEQLRIERIQILDEVKIEFPKAENFIARLKRNTELNQKIEERLRAEIRSKYPKPDRRV